MPGQAGRTSQDITRLLLAWGEGDLTAFDRLVPLVYGELHEIARRQLRRLRPGDTLATTGLVHEAYLKLVNQERADWKNRQHFLAIAARAMRQILVDWARRKQSQKRGGGAEAETLSEARELASPPDEEWLLDVNAALERLAEVDPRLPRVVECRFFAGYTQEETAEALGVSTFTVWRDWKLARAWLQAELEDSAVEPALEASC